MKIAFELTNSCNCSCDFCFRDNGISPVFLDFSLIKNVVKQAVNYGPETLIVMTGGEPTIHPQFIEILEMIRLSKLQCAIVTNGWNLRKFFSPLTILKENIDHITFSLDSAVPKNHDSWRKKSGLFNHVLQGISFCVIKEIPFRINVVVHKKNVDELEKIALMAAKLHCQALAFCHYMGPYWEERFEDSLYIGYTEWKVIEEEIALLDSIFKMPVRLAGDHLTNGFSRLCSQLQGHDINIDYFGNITACCMLSTSKYFDESIVRIADLKKGSLEEGYKHLLQWTEKIITAKRLARKRRIDQQELGTLCHQCYLHCAKAAPYSKKQH